MTQIDDQLSTSDEALVALLDGDAAVRRAAVDRVPADSAGCYALRSAMLEDSDATVRASAAERLGRIAANPGDSPASELETWLLGALQDACSDSHLSVRDAAYRALGRAPWARAPRARESLDFPRAILERAVASEPIWSARRSAVLALAQVAGKAAVPALIAVLDDPFWRVRHAAIRALAVLGAADSEVREAVGAAPQPSIEVAAAVEYLIRGFTDRTEPALSPAPRPEPVLRGDRTIAPAWDPDPAVMTARFEDPDIPVSAAMLVHCLADSHEPLRKLAIARLTRSGDARALRAALAWLDDPRMPHAARSVTQVLDELGDGARDLADEILDPLPSSASSANDRAIGPGALIWAISWVARTGALELLDGVMARAKDRHARVRCAAIAAIGQALGDRFSLAEAGRGSQVSDLMQCLIDALDDEDSAAVREAAWALASSRELDATHPGYRALAGLAYAEQDTAMRRVLLAAAAAVGHGQRLDEALGDRDPLCRARAGVALARLGALGPEQLEALLRDPDPHVRAALVPAIAEPERLAALLGVAGADTHRRERDPRTRRALARHLVAERRGGGASAALALQVAEILAGSPDPILRMRAAQLLALAGPDTGPDESAVRLPALLTLSADSAPMVRTAAADALAAMDRLDFHLRQLLGSEDTEDTEGREGTTDAVVRKSAYTWLAREFEPGVGQALVAALRRGQEPDAVAQHLRGILAAYPELADRPSIASESKAPRRRHDHGRSAPDIDLPVPDVTRRALGKSGIEVAPLALSGVFDLPVWALERAHRAGVDLFFWEPRHAALTRFVRASRARRQGLHIATGTFHASPAAIESDVETALRRLRTDHIDIFLLFWARSEARLSDQAYQCLDRLKAAGKVRAIGFSTHDRGLCAQALGAHSWDVAMIRHNAAHRGAEDEILPIARQRQVGVLTFSALCYGRMLRAMPGGARPPSAADCYRYSLSQDGVSACISAPRRYRELIHNLEVLGSPTLGSAAVAALRAHGREVYERNRDFNVLVRREPRVLPRSDARAGGQGDDRATALLDDYGDHIALSPHLER